MQRQALPTLPRGSAIEWLKDAFMGGTGKPFLTQYDLATPKWPKDYPPLKLIFLSDLHVGCPAMTLERLGGLVDRVNTLKPDLILLGGDYLNDEGSPNGPYVSPRDMAKVLRGLKASFRHGVCGVGGNHDAHKKTEVFQVFRENGIIMFENDAMKFNHPDRPQQKVYVAGLADDLTGTIDLAKTFEKARGAEPLILLEHNPSAFDAIAAFSDRAVVTLAGHTHGAQVDGPGRRLMDLPGNAPWKYVLGHSVVNGSNFIVSSGMGTSGLPLRVNCPARIVEVVLRHSPA
ncbi:MAG: Phosphoesterase [Micavibrio sp.]|nr:Phosphoesterase [Micavibrio sp.]